MNKWFKLENAAKIFPPTSTKRDTKVFRFVCQLYKPIVPNLLQKALDKTITFFPNFQTVLKHGLFWYYLEETKYHAIVKEEDKLPCSPLSNKHKLLFRVHYYQKRINLEIYHVLTDGTGALEFFKTLIYLYLCYEQKMEIDYRLLENGSSFSEKAMDSFDKYYKASHFSNPLVKAYRFKGEKLPDYNFHIIQGIVNTEQLLSLAHLYHTTITSFVISLYLSSILENISEKDKKKHLVVDIPVNLRKYFPSQTTRNFFSVLKLNYKGSNQLEEIIAYVDHFLKEKLTKEQLTEIMNSYATLEHNFLVRLTPLFLKNWFMRLGNSIVGKKTTTSVSNLGVITMPEEVKKFIDHFEVFIGNYRQQICLCSYNYKTVISFTSAFVNTDIIKTFYRKLHDFNIEITLITNEVD